MRMPHEVHHRSTCVSHLDHHSDRLHHLIQAPWLLYKRYARWKVITYFAPVTGSHNDRHIGPSPIDHDHDRQLPTIKLAGKREVCHEQNALGLRLNQMEQSIISCEESHAVSTNIREHIYEDALHEGIILNHYDLSDDPFVVMQI